jgi:hypothetical protein
MLLKGRGFSRAGKLFIFCHHELALAREGSAFLECSANRSAALHVVALPNPSQSVKSLWITQL